jgi:hypothetical protein
MRAGEVEQAGNGGPRRVNGGCMAGGFNIPAICHFNCT